MKKKTEPKHGTHLKINDITFYKDVYIQIYCKWKRLNKCLTQLSGKYLSTISRIFACWVCSMEGLKKRQT